AHDRQALLHVVRVGNLPEDAVRDVVEHVGASWSELTEAQGQMLQVPQHLFLWTKLPNNVARSSFRTPTDLMRAFWQHVRFQVGEMAVTASDTESALRLLALRLDHDGRLTAPSRVLDPWPQVRNAL